MRMHKLILFDCEHAFLDIYSKDYTVFDARKDILVELNPKEPIILLGMFDNPCFTIKNGDAFDNFVAQHLNRAGCSCTVDDFKSCYLKYFRKVSWWDDMVDLTNSLAACDQFHVGIVASLCEMDLQLIKEKIAWKNIDYCFCSFNLGVQRPDPGIYGIVETVSGCAGDDILFVSDAATNSPLAMFRHWNTVNVTGENFPVVQKSCMDFLEGCTEFKMSGA